jgi:glycosyltransferase involved in cell wall biosynthesis
LGFGNWNLKNIVMLYIDASRYNNTVKKTGVENYSFFLINELVKSCPDDITLISPKKIPLDVKQIIIPFPRLWTQIRLSWEIQRNKKIDNLFVPSHVLPLITPNNSTITIHDVAFKHLPESYGFLSRLYLDWAAKFAVKHAKKIIVPSQVTKKDLIDFYKCPADKIHVIPLGFSANTAGVNSDEESKVIGHYLLYVGRIEHKKNTDTLIKAFALFSEKAPEIKLVLAGSKGRGGEEILNSIPDNLKDRVIVTGYVSDNEKHVLMQNAMCFIFPSRYEGFGLPLLEAMHYKLPIIASRIPTSYEIAKENALFFDTENAEKLASLMTEVVSNKDLRSTLVQSHADTLKKYSWENCAKQTLDILSL